MSEESEPIETTVLVDKDQLNKLIDQNVELKQDVIALVNVFQGFSGLFQGKPNIMTLASTIAKLMKNKEQLESLSHIIPIIEKYSVNNTNGKDAPTE